MKSAVLFSFLAFLGLATLGEAAPSRSDLVTEVQSCEAILQQFTTLSPPSQAIPPAILAQARALIIVNQFKAGFLFGIKAGYGVVMVKRATGPGKPDRWSVPVLIDAGETSLGLQIGAKSVETVYVVNDDSIPRLLFNGRVRLGADAKAVIGPKSAEADTFRDQIAPVLVYTRNSGAFVGATVKVGFFSRNDEANFTLYGTQYGMPELLYSDWVTPVPEVVPLMNLVQQVAP